MTGWKRTTGAAAVLTLMSLIAIAGEAPPPPREGGQPAAGQESRQPAERRAELQAKLTNILEPALIKQLVSELSITEEKAKEVLAVYKEAGEKMNAAIKEAGKTADPTKRREAFLQTRGIMQKSLEGKLDAQKLQAALGILSSSGQVQSSIMLFIQAKVEDAKIAKAVPVLTKFQADALPLRIGVGPASSEERTAKFNELRDKTAKELAPIVGEEAAATWKERADRLTGFGLPRRGEGAPGGVRVGGRRDSTEGTAPTEPVAP